MDTKDFKRNVAKTSNFKAMRAGIKGYTRKVRTTGILYEVVELNVAMGLAFRTLRPYIEGYGKLNLDLLKAARTDLGVVLHHACILAKLVKVKIPRATKKGKVVGTASHIFTGMSVTLSEMLNAVTAAMQPAAIEEVEKSTPRGKKMVTVYTPSELDEAKIQALLSEFLSQFWGLYRAFYEGPVGDLMEEHIAALKPAFPPTFFDAPPAKAGKKPAPPAKKLKVSATK